MESTPVKKRGNQTEISLTGQMKDCLLWCVLFFRGPQQSLTLNYVTIPGVPQKNIDPTFIASVFTGSLAFGVVPAKSGGQKRRKGKEEPAKEKV